MSKFLGHKNSVPDVKPKNQPPMAWTSFASASIGFSVKGCFSEEQIAERRVQAMVDSAEHSAAHKELQQNYQRAMAKGLEFVFENCEKQLAFVRKNHLDKKYRGAITHCVDMLEHCRKFDFLEHRYKDIDEKIKELNVFLALMDAYWQTAKEPRY